MSEQFEPRAAAKGTEVSVIVGNQERTLKATKRKDGWAITPHDAAEAAALAAFSDEALDPSLEPEPELATAPDDEADLDDEPADLSTGNDDDAGDGEGDQV